MREVIYDTETTGKRAGIDRIVEIGAIELEDGVPTGRVFHEIINPECHISDEVIAVHGITNERVKDAPKFREIMPALIEFMRGARAIAHNSDFDEKMIDGELKRAEHRESIWGIFGDTVDTMRWSRRIWTGKDEEGKLYKHSLDALLDRCQIDRSNRTLHGALLDSELLVGVYLNLKQKLAELGPGLEDDCARPPVRRVDLSGVDLPMISIQPVAAAPRAFKP